MDIVYQVPMVPSVPMVFMVPMVHLWYKQKVKEAYGAAAKILDWSSQDEPYFEELDVAETEELAENDPGGPGEVVQMQDESENKKGLEEA